MLGQSFTSAAAAALADRSEAEVKGVLDRLVAKQVLGRDDDPRSPERGQYVFLQTLLRTVAYGTLARRTRKARHLQAARYLEQTWPGQLADIAEVLAAHYLEAIRADPEADDVAVLRASALETLSAAGRAAASLGLGPEASRYFEQGAELTEDELDRARLLELGGRALWQSGDTDGAEQRLGHAIELHKRNGSASGGSAAVTLAAVVRQAGRIEDARALLEPFRAGDDAGLDPVVRAEALAGLALVTVFEGSLAEASPLFEEALATLEVEQSWPALAGALISHGIYLFYSHRVEGAAGLLRQALVLAEEHELTEVALRARYNLAAISLARDRLGDAVSEVEAGLVLARERGDRRIERQLLAQELAPLVVLGRWDEAAPIGTTLTSGPDDREAIFAAAFVVQIADGRSDQDTLERCLSIAATRHDSADVDQVASAATVLARLALARGAPDETLRYARPILDGEATSPENIVEAYSLCVDAALALGDEKMMAELEAIVSALPRARATPLLRAGAARLAAERAHLAGDTDRAQASEREAIDLLRAVGAQPMLARALLDRSRRRDDPQALAEARAIYTALGATRWLERIDQGRSVTA